MILFLLVEQIIHWIAGALTTSYQQQTSSFSVLEKSISKRCFYFLLKLVTFIFKFPS